MVWRRTLHCELHRGGLEDGSDLEFFEDLITLLILGRSHIDEPPLEEGGDGLNGSKGDLELDIIDKKCRVVNH